MSDQTTYAADPTAKLTTVEEQLTIVQHFALVGMAYQTTDAGIRRWAIDTLERASATPPFIAA